MLNPIDCPAGGYCPAYDALVAYAIPPPFCAIGSYSTALNIGTQADCIPCPVGKYCAGSGAAGPSGDCNAGTYCPIGSTVADASGLAVHIIGTNDQGPCPKGYLCPAGAIAPEPCPKGSYGYIVGSSSCVPCRGGMYCDELGMSDDTFNEKNKRCDAGYYCKSGSQVPYPTGDPNATGDICPPGNFCVEGSSAPAPCVGGTFENRKGSY